jgi:hypothetical protein
MLAEDSDGFAISSADLLSDFLAEHGDDPLEGPPEGWPDEYDSIRVAIGPAWSRAESFDDDPLPLTDQGDLEELRRVERLDWQGWPDEYDSIRETIGPAVCPDPFTSLPEDDLPEIPF